jgi:hypothetical protein
MAAKFQTRISKARFVYSPYTGQQMASFGQSLVDSIKARLAMAQDTQDQPAPPLKDRYRKSKQRRYGRGDRDWNWTGRTMRGLRVIRANQNRAVIGFYDPIASQRAFFNQRRHRQWGVSLVNRRDLIAAMNGNHPVKASGVA